jgi:hypothetical protein
MVPSSLSIHQTMAWLDPRIKRPTEGPSVEGLVLLDPADRLQSKSTLTADCCWRCGSAPGGARSRGEKSCM